jgi:hypothetical protein
MEGEHMRLGNGIGAIASKILVAIVVLGVGAIPLFAQCDGLPHPENGQPAPCWPSQSLPNPNSGDAWRATQQQRERQLQEDTERREQQKRDELHRCELQAQHDYQECARKNPTGYCPLKPCS